jgi:hypothetical protein
MYLDDDEVSVTVSAAERIVASQASDTVVFSLNV